MKTLRILQIGLQLIQISADIYITMTKNIVACRTRISVHKNIYVLKLCDLIEIFAL